MTAPIEASLQGNAHERLEAEIALRRTAAETGGRGLFAFDIAAEVPKPLLDASVDLCLRCGFPSPPWIAFDSEITAYGDDATAFLDGRIRIPHGFGGTRVLPLLDAAAKASAEAPATLILAGDGYFGDDGDADVRLAVEALRGLGGRIVQLKWGGGAKRFLSADLIVSISTP